MRKEWLSIFLCATLAAQQATPPETPIFRASANLVIITVFARGSDGKPVTGLTKDDFVVTENGKPQTISVFEWQELKAADTLPPLPPPPKQLKTRDAVEEPKPAPVVAPAEPKPAEPEGRARYRDKRLMVMFFDWTSLPAADQVRAKDAAEKFVNEQLTPTDFVSLMSFSSKLKVDLDFTDDREALLAQIRKYQAGTMSELSATEETSEDTEEDAAFDASDPEFNVFNMDQKLGALEDVARRLGALPEKKAVVYFTSGTGKTGADNQSQLRATVNAAVRSNVSFFPVDVRGLTAEPPGGGASSSARLQGTGIFSGRTQNQQRQRMLDQQDTLTSLALDTGGKTSLDSNDLVAGVKQAQTALQSYYILGYYSSDERRDGQFRKVGVKLAEASQARVRARLDYRSGYFAAKEFAEFTGYDKERQLSDALLLGDPVTDLPLAVEANWFRLATGKYFVPVAVKIPGSEIPLAKKGSAEQTEFDFIGVIRDAKRVPIANLRDSIRIKLREQNAGQLASRSLTYDTGFTLAPGAYRLRMLVRENQTGKMGTFDLAFTIPDLDKLSDAVKLSSVVWSSQRIAMVEAVGSADGKVKKDNKHPLVRDGKKLMPSVTRAFRSGQTLYVFAEVYQAAAPTALTAALTMYRDGKPAFEAAPVRVRNVERGKNGGVPVLFETPLAKLSPGRYIAQLTITDQAGQKFGYARAPVVVLGK